MLLLILLFYFLPNHVSCIFHIDRAEIESNPSIGSLEVNYVHDVKGNSIINATFSNSVTITKSLLYFKMRVAEDKNDKEYKRQLISSVLDVDKVLKGFQSNIVISRFFAAFKKGMDLKFKHPLAPVSIFLTATFIFYLHVHWLRREFTNLLTLVTLRQAPFCSTTLQAWLIFVSWGRLMAATPTNLLLIWLFTLAIDLLKFFHRNGRKKCKTPVSKEK